MGILMLCYYNILIIEVLKFDELLMQLSLGSSHGHSGLNNTGGMSAEH